VTVTLTVDHKVNKLLFFFLSYLNLFVLICLSRVTSYFVGICTLLGQGGVLHIRMRSLCTLTFDHKVNLFFII
jgi:hypothetical protein